MTEADTLRMVGLRMVGRMAVRCEELILELERLRESVRSCDELGQTVDRQRGELYASQQREVDLAALMKRAVDDLTAQNARLAAESQSRANIGDRLRDDLRECAFRAEWLSHRLGNSLRDLELSANGQPPSLRKLAKVRRCLREAAVGVLAIHGRASGSGT